MTEPSRTGQDEREIKLSQTVHSRLCPPVVSWPEVLVPRDPDVFSEGGGGRWGAEPPPPCLSTAVNRGINLRRRLSGRERVRGGAAPLSGPAPSWHLLGLNSLPRKRATWEGLPGPHVFTISHSPYTWAWVPARRRGPEGRGSCGATERPPSAEERGEAGSRKSHFGMTGQRRAPRVPSPGPPARASPRRGPQGGSGLNRTFAGPWCRLGDSGAGALRPGLGMGPSAFPPHPIHQRAAVSTSRRRRSWNAPGPGALPGRRHRGEGGQPSAVPSEPAVGGSRRPRRGQGGEPWAHPAGLARPPAPPGLRAKTRRAASGRVTSLSAWLVRPGRGVSGFECFCRFWVEVGIPAATRRG